MNPTRTKQLRTLQAENSRLLEELQLKDQLVEQLSGEVLRLVEGNVNVLPPEVYQNRAREMHLLRSQLQQLEKQVQLYAERIAEKDRVIEELEQSAKDLTEHSRMLEQLLEELPHTYQQKFAQRLGAVQEKVEQLQRENREQKAELHRLSYLLAVQPDSVGQGNDQIETL